MKHKKIKICTAAEYEGEHCIEILDYFAKRIFIVSFIVLYLYFIKKMNSAGMEVTANIWVHIGFLMLSFIFAFVPTGFLFIDSLARTPCPT